MAEDSDNKASILITEYGVMKTVLKQLPIKQLNKAATVCKAWNETSKIIKKTRNQIYSFGGANEGKKEECHENLKEFFEVMHSQPHLCIAFLMGVGMYSEMTPRTASIPETEGCCEDRKDEYINEKLLQKQLPRNCSLLGGVSHGVIFSDTNLETKEIEDGDAFGLLLIPNLGDVAIRNFYLNRLSMKKLGKAIVNQSDDAGHLLSMQRSDEIQCLILLALDHGRESRYLEAICRYVQERNQNVAIGGGFMETLIHPNSEKDEYSGILGLAFCGTRVRAHSIVIPESANTAPEVEKMILQLKQSHKLGKRSIGFMFACVARGANFFGETGIESSIFRKHFPNTPLLGFFGNGEIGVNNLGDQHRNLIPSGPKKSRTTYLYSYSTTFVLLSFLE